MDERHHLTFDTYEEGKLTLEEYLDRVVFYEVKPFTSEDFKAYLFAQSQPIPEMIDLISRLKVRHVRKVATISNEGRELTMYRIKKFNPGAFVDFFYLFLFRSHPQTGLGLVPHSSGLRPGTTGTERLHR